MNYGRAISSAFSTLKSGSLWGFAASVYAAIAALFLVFMGGAVAVSGPSDLMRLLSRPSQNPNVWLGPVIMLGGALILAILLTIPFALVLRGGLVHLSDEILAKRPVSVGQGWSFGFHRMGRVLAVDAVVGVIEFAAVTVALIPFGLAFVGLIAGSNPGSPSAGAIAGICCGYLIFLLFIVAISLLSGAYEAIAIRYGLVGSRTAGAALGAGWQAFRARWKNVVVCSLIVLGLSYVFSAVTSMVTWPLQFMLLPDMFATSGASPSIDQLPRYVVAYVIIIVVSVVLSIPWLVFQYSLWSAFFRQLTGLDVVITAPVAPEAPTPPTTPTPQTPFAPEPPVAEGPGPHA